MTYNQKNVAVRLMTKTFQEKNAFLAEQGGLPKIEVEAKMKEMTPTIFWMLESVYDALLEENYIKND
jgi:hypothetical protein